MSEPGLRERKKAATRAALRTAAIRLARRHGPDAVTVEAVCAAADVSARTFFNHFATKDDAFFAADPVELDRTAAAVVARHADESPWEAVGAVLAEVVDAATGSSVWHEQLMLLREHPELLARMQASSRAFEDAVARGLARRTDRVVGDPWVVTTAAVAMAVLRVALGLWLDRPDGSDPRRILGDTVALVRGGLAPPA